MTGVQARSPTCVNLLLCLSVLPIRWSNFLTAASAVQVVEVDGCNSMEKSSVLKVKFVNIKYHHGQELISVCRRATPPEIVRTLEVSSESLRTWPCREVSHLLCASI